MVSDYIETGEDFLWRTKHGETVHPDDARRVVMTLVEALRAVAAGAGDRPPAPSDKFGPGRLWWDDFRKEIPEDYEEVRLHDPAFLDVEKWVLRVCRFSEANDFPGTTPIAAAIVRVVRERAVRPTPRAPSAAAIGGLAFSLCQEHGCPAGRHPCNRCVARASVWLQAAYVVDFGAASPAAAPREEKP